MMKFGASNIRGKLNQVKNQKKEIQKKKSKKRKREKEKKEKKEKRACFQWFWTKYVSFVFTLFLILSKA